MQMGQNIPKLPLSFILFTGIFYVYEVTRDQKSCNADVCESSQVAQRAD